MQKCVLYFDPIQSGSGIPSPNNIRPLSGWNEISIYFGTILGTPNETSSINFPSTIYGGYVDMISGELIATKKYIHFTGNENWTMTTSSLADAPYRSYVTNVDVSNKQYKPIISDKLGSDTNWQPGLFKGNVNNGGHFIMGLPNELSTKDAVKAWIASLGGIDIVFDLTNPISYQLSPQIIKNHNILIKFREPM